jgi:predicted phosphoribosyltransferase
MEGKTVIMVDDGLATGASMRAALIAARKQRPRKLIAAAPTGAQETCRKLEEHADEVICYQAPVSFNAVGNWYLDFAQTSDREVLNLLEKSSSMN